jgi:uncharacterized membrane protein YGL010W
MRTAAEWFELYGESHRNPVNRVIHKVCVPIIAVSTLGLLQAIPSPFGALVHFGTIGGALAMLFYATLTPRLAVGMAALIVGALAINGAIAGAGLPIGIVSAVVWGIAWVAQFVGHHIEGKKPSFLQDAQFLLVGPAWVLEGVFVRLGLPASA